jgi:carbonic anhydrase/acetyltransferase-like protein (isoleucine patch superfamily)
MGAIVLDGAVVNSFSFVAAGALVTPGFVIPEGKLVAGVPAKIIRDLTEEEKDNIRKSAEHYIQIAKFNKQSLSK